MPVVFNEVVDTSLELDFLTTLCTPGLLALVVSLAQKVAVAAAQLF